MICDDKLIFSEENTGCVESEALVMSCSQQDEVHPTPQPTVELDAVQGPSPVHRPATRKAPEKADKGQHQRPKGKKDIPK